MKFSEIPQFTPHAPYTVDISFPDIQWQLDIFKRDYGLIMYPDFQRLHVWTAKQSIAYVEYLLRGGQSGRDIYFNHPGWLHDFEGTFVLVDGLQRLTACTDFINNLIPVFGQYHRNFEDDLHPMKITLRFHINTLKRRQDVLRWYIEMNSGGTPHTWQELNRAKQLYEKAAQEP